MLELVLSKDGTQAYWVSKSVASDSSHQSAQSEQAGLVRKLIEDKMTNNRNTLDSLLKEKGYDRDSGIGKELVKIYNDTQDKLNKELEGLKSQVVDIAISDFNDR